MEGAIDQSLKSYTTVLALLLTSYRILGILLKALKPQVSYLDQGDNNTSFADIIPIHKCWAYDSVSHIDEHDTYNALNRTCSLVEELDTCFNKSTLLEYSISF